MMCLDTVLKCKKKISCPLPQFIILELFFDTSCFPLSFLFFLIVLQLQHAWMVSLLPLLFSVPQIRALPIASLIHMLNSTIGYLQNGSNTWAETGTYAYTLVANGGNSRMLSYFERDAISVIGLQINCLSTKQATIISRDPLIGMYWTIYICFIPMFFH